MAIIIIALTLLGACVNVQAIPNGTNSKISEAEVYNQSKLNKWELLNSLGIYDGVSIKGNKLSGKSRLTSVEILKDEYDHDLDEMQIEFYKDDFNYKYSLRELGFDYDYDEATKKAFNLGRESDSEENLKKIEELKENPVDIDLDLKLNDDILEGIINKMSDDIHIDPINGKFQYDAENDKVFALPGEDGRDIDVDQLKKFIDENKLTGEKIQIPVVSIPVDPNYLAKADRINGVIGSAESYFRTGFWQRVTNIEVSTSYLNGVVVGPGETFSVNDQIGDTTADKGYMEAVVIVDNKEVPGMGGGVCQTSTALYQAALKADLEIINRSPHSMKMSYAEGGLDATIEYGSADLVFRNQYDFPILIKSYYEPGRIYFEIWGDTEVKNYEVTLYNEFLYSIPYSTTYINDSSLAPGTQVVDRPGITGSAYEAYKRNESTGEVTSLGLTYYPAIDQVIRKN